MKRTLTAAFLLASALFSQEFRVGSKVRDFDLTDLNGKPLKFSALKGPTTVVAFISTQCPVSNAYNERMKLLYEDYAAKGVRFIFLNANQNESPAEVKQHAADHAFAFPIYKDTNNVAADLFGAQFTPETYVIDKEGIVRYHGHIDNAQNEARVTRRSLRDAIDAVMARKEVPVKETKAFGCTIKRVRKTAS